MGFIGSAIESQRTTSGQSTSASAADPVLFGPGQLRTRTRARGLQQAEPALLSKAFGGQGGERRRRKTAAFGDIGLSEKSALGNLRETFGRSGVRGGVQGADVSDILEAGIGARGAASTSIEDALSQLNQQDIGNLLALLTSQEPFAVGQRQRATSISKNLSANPFGDITTFGAFGKGGQAGNTVF